MKRIIVALAMVAASVFNWRKIGAGLLPIALMSALVVVGSTPAQAVEGNDLPCVAAAAYTETITPASNETVVDHAAYDEVIPGTPGQWWNWSPNRSQDPFVGPPAFATDSRGTWQGPHTEGGPDGIGTYQVGQGNGSWFHREAGTPDTTVHHDAVTHTVHHDAVTVDHPAVVCDPTNQVTATPAALPIQDECGIGNASWIDSGDTSNDFSWDLTDAGALSAHAHKGYVFANHETVIEFGPAPESNTEACPPAVTQETDTRQVVGEPDCAAGYSIVSYQEGTRAVTDGVPGKWTEWVQVDNGTIPTTVEECPIVVVSPVDVCQDIAGDQLEGTDCTQPKKVFVCKFVGKPGVDERLQTGQNPISASVNSLIGNTEETIRLGDEFSDARGRSVVVEFEGDNLGPTRADCVSQIRPPAPPDKVNPVSDGTVVSGAGVLPNTGGSPLGLLAISGLLIAGGVMVIGRRRTS